MMGGKRTKNNTKPSSSGRSAELLGTSVPTLFGFAALDSASLPVVPGFVQIDANHSIDEMDPNLDDTLQIVLRKMLKKDRTTKTKALLEFIELMKNAELEVVKAVLPFWPKLFVNLSTDADHRVRETAQQAQAVIVSRAGKNIAPFLRQLIPAWISSQSDTYASAASVALQSFNNTFPPGKVSEVFVFCENEILEYFTKNLTVHTAITLSNPKSHSPEECENKYQLVLISSLRGYALYLSRIPAENLKKSAELNAKILESPKFWTYHKHKTAAIRSAWFEVMSALLQYGPFLVEGHQAQITTSVFQFLDEADPSVVTHVWALIVLVQAKLSEWHSHLNFDKAVFPKLWKLIKSGGAGNAACVFPHMLPLVSGFTREVLGNERLAKFYSLFFESMNEGLKTVQSSRLDVSAVSQAYYETFQYVVLQVLRDDAMTESEREEFCSNMLEQHLIGVIAWSITSEAACGKYVFQHMANLLDHWCQHSTTYTQYERLLVTFWERLYGIVKESVDNKNNTSCITDSHVDLIQNLRRTSHKRVKFAVENPSEDAVDGVVACPLTTGNHASRFESQLQLLVYRICQLYIAKISVDRDEGYILQLEYLVRAFQCRELFIFLANGSENIKCLFDPFARWLQDTKLQSEYIVELVMILYKYLNAEERLVLLNKWIKMSNAIVQRWIILRALSHPLCQEPNIRMFLAQPEVSNIITEWAVGVANGNTKDNMILLQKCFFVASNGEILIDAKTCEKIIDTITVPLQDALKVELHDGCISFLAQIMPVICSDARLTELHRSLFCTLFDFSVHNVVSDHLSEDTLWEATTAWQDALSGEDIELDNALLVRCIGTIDDRLRTLSSEKQDDILALLEKVSEIVAKLFACASEPNKHDKSQRCQEIHSMLEQFFAKRESEDRKQTEELSFLAEYVEVIQGKLLTKQLQQSTAPSISDQMFVNTMKSSFVRAICMLNVVLKLSCKAKLNPSANNEQMKVDQPTESDDRDEMETYENTDEDNGDLCVLHLWSESIYEKVLSVIYLATIGDTILYNSEELESVVECLILAVQEKLTLLLKNVSQDVVAQIKQKLFALSNDRGMLWAKSLTTLLVINQYADEESGPVLLYEDASIAANNSEDLVAYVNIVQCLGAKMQPKCLPISPNLFENYFDVLVKLSSARCLIDNHFSTNYNEMNDRKIIGNCLIVLHELISRQATNKMLQYNCDLAQADENNIFLDMEVANVLTTVLRYFPTELDIGKWDFIRIALSSWTLSVSKSFTHFRTHNISLFIGALYRLFHGLMLFFAIERKRSSSELMSNVIEEWDNVFAKDVNLVLLKAFIGIVNTIEHQRKSDQYFIESICPYIESVDFSYVLKANKIDSKTSLDDLMTFSLNNIRHWNKRVRFAATAMLKSLSVGLIQRDLEQLLKRSESSDQQQKCAEEPEESWHLLQRFKHQLDQYQELLGGCIADFNYKPLDADSPLKLADNDNLQETRSHCLSFLLLWDCILGICAKAPSELRSIYAFWISGNKFEQLLLPILFKLMPQEILRNPDSCAVYGQAMFSSLEWSQIKNPSTKLERYACHLYTQTLRHLPVIVRRWFNGLNHRHSLIVSKITANSVSGMLCQEEFQSLIERKDRQDNMQIKVHSTLRQVMAVYSIDETKLELHITLPNNFPLGAVAVEGGKQIGGRLQSRQVVMQLSIFLTHQNGSIYDGLSLWKRNLDRKFEGVEECYVCYSVIHQDTCQLPKLSCKTCKKKFHGPCLYRWFSTSNKSTCPICRNIF